MAWCDIMCLPRALTFAGSVQISKMLKIIDAGIFPEKRELRFIISIQVRYMRRIIGRK